MTFFSRRPQHKGYKTAELTTPTLQPIPAQQKLLIHFSLIADSQKIHFLLCLGVHLQLNPINYAQKFTRPGCARAPSASLWLRLWP